MNLVQISTSLKKVLKHIIHTPRRLKRWRKLQKMNFTVLFENDGAISVKLPRISFLKAFFGVDISVEKNIQYASRPHAEVLLRRIIYELYQSGFIDSSGSIIDIGCWISDNSIVWSQFLTSDGCVFAIDPSRNNQLYGKSLARLNQIDNINFVQAVCADEAGIGLDFDGSIDHATFKKSSLSPSIQSTTIDNIVNSYDKKIGFFHVDVEGFELAVLKGAKRVIERDLPVICFELHISKEKSNEIFEFLRIHNYRIFMINEILKGCDLDCRNFIAFPDSKGIPKLRQFDQSSGLSLGVVSAIIGDTIIEILH